MTDHLSVRACRGCGARGARLSQRAHSEVCEAADVVTLATPPDRLLLCLDPACHGEFYYPLTPDESIGCPVDGMHDVAVYQGPSNHQGNRP
jgi:hypothetical protein